MTERGDVTIVADDHYYSLYVQSGMEISGHIADLLSEAADISRLPDGWAEIAAGWTSKTWLDSPDDELEESLRSTVQHPDGDYCDRGSWSYNMRPRLSRQQMIDMGRAKEAAHVFGANPWAVSVSRPGWRAAAEMPCMLKEGFGFEEHEYSKTSGVVVDLDNNEIVCLRYEYGPHWDDGILPTPIAVALLSDPYAIDDLARWALGPRTKIIERDVHLHMDDERAYLHPSVGGPAIIPFEPHETYWQRRREALAAVPDADTIRREAVTHTARDWRSVIVNKELRDGQWLRPPGFPPLPDTPEWYPAMDQAQNTSSADAVFETGRLRRERDNQRREQLEAMGAQMCGVPTKEGGSCGNAVSPGKHCAAGHYKPPV